MLLWRNYGKRLLASSFLSACLSVHPHRTTVRVFIKIYIWVLLKICQKFNHDKYLKRITGTLHKDTCTLMIIPRWILLRMINVSCKTCAENQNIFYVQQLFRHPTIYGITWKNVVKLDRPAIDDNITQRMRFACWISKVTDKHSEHVMRIALPRQQ
jgi:hypothetical protein